MSALLGAHHGLPTWIIAGLHRPSANLAGASSREGGLRVLGQLVASRYTLCYNRTHHRTAQRMMVGPD
jgi:hypothetical protein